MSRDCPGVGCRSVSIEMGSRSFDDIGGRADILAEYKSEKRRLLTHSPTHGRTGRRQKAKANPIGLFSALVVLELQLQTIVQIDLSCNAPEFARQTLLVSVANGNGS